MSKLNLRTRRSVLHPLDDLRRKLIIITFQLNRQNGEALDEHDEVREVHEPDGPGEEGGAKARAEEEQEAEAVGSSGRPEG